MSLLPSYLRNKDDSDEITRLLQSSTPLQVVSEVIFRQFIHEAAVQEDLNSMPKKIETMTLTHSKAKPKAGNGYALIDNTSGISLQVNETITGSGKVHLVITEEKPDSRVAVMAELANVLCRVESTRVKIGQKDGNDQAKQALTLMLDGLKTFSEEELGEIVHADEEEAPI